MQILRRRIVWMGPILVAVIVSLPACSKPKPVDPADAAQVRNIDATVERLRQAYVNKDLTAFEGLLMPTGTLKLLKEEVERDFSTYERMTVEFVIDRISIDGPDVAVAFHWQGQWDRKMEERPFRERGQAVLRFVGQRSLSLSKVDGDAPFGMASRRVLTEGGR